MLSPFDFKDYRAYLAAVFASPLAMRGFQGQLAKAAGCHASYLSQAVAGKVELTPDHAVGIAQYLALSGDECEFFLNMVHLSRAHRSELRQIHIDKMKQLKTSRSELSRRIPLKSKSSEMNFYYSSWIYLALHFALGIENLRTDENLAARFGLSRTEVMKALQKLSQHGLAEQRKDGWHPLNRQSHLDSNDFMTEVNHMNYRLRALRDIQRDQSAWVHYTSVFTMSKADALELREMVLNFIVQTRKSIESSGEEEIYSFLVDLFPV